MKRMKAFMKVTAMLAGLTLMAALLACNDNSTPVASSLPAPKSSLPNPTDAKRLSDGANKLMDAMNKPAESFHFSFKGQMNISEDKTQPPKVGPVALEADVSPGEISLTETRGSTTKNVQGQEGRWP